MAIPATLCHGQVKFRVSDEEKSVGIKKMRPCSWLIAATAGK
jgi:hypothetical protein